MYARLSLTITLFIDILIYYDNYKMQYLQMCVLYNKYSINTITKEKYDILAIVLILNMLLNLLCLYCVRNYDNLFDVLVVKVATACILSKVIFNIYDCCRGDNTYTIHYLLNSEINLAVFIDFIIVLFTIVELIIMLSLITYVYCCVWLNVESI